MFQPAYLQPMPERIRIEGKQLAVVIAGWLRALPKWVWGEEPGYAKLKKEWRHDASSAPDPKRMAADLIAEKLHDLGWDVSYDEKGNLFGDQIEPPRSP
jgi:hypothetical protein